MERKVNILYGGTHANNMVQIAKKITFWTQIGVHYGQPIMTNLVLEPWFTTNNIVYICPSDDKSTSVHKEGDSFHAAN